MTATIVTIDPLFDEGPGPMVGLAQRFGDYRTYGEHEKLEIDIGRGLQQRHDSILHFLRSGGLRGAAEPAPVLAARTVYFREEYAYGELERAPGIGAFLHSGRLADAARVVHDAPVVVPAIAYANLMVPGQELAVHTDVPEFRGANRKVLPQWLLVVMHHSGLFERWRLRIATGIAWFHDSDHGALAYWPNGPDAAVVHHRIRANTALVLDTDTVFHGVDRVTDDSPDIVPPVRPTTVLRPPADPSADPAWTLVDGEDGEVARYEWDELRFSVSWKAYCFSDEDERTAWTEHSDDLDERAVVNRLVADLADRGLAAPDVPRDPDLGLLLIDTYVEFPGEIGR